MSEFKIHKVCRRSMARLSTLPLTVDVSLPAFMPVATYAAMRAISLKDLKSDLILSNTYHCRGLGNLKAFNGWSRGLLTDSGGFQIGSLKGAEVIEEGVVFPRIQSEDDEDCKRSKAGVFTPEESIRIQNRLGADIIMQLDDVVPPTSPRVEEAMHRSLRWLERCLKSHKTSQLLFPIVQGGLDLDLRSKSLTGILKNKVSGIAIGGLCGGESKIEFCRVVHHCTRIINRMCAGGEGPGKQNTAKIPIYVMGVGYPEDVVVCVALGCDMMDCVYPTRTARFGKMLTDCGDINVNKVGDITAKGIKKARKGIKNVENQLNADQDTKGKAKKDNGQAAHGMAGTKCELEEIQDPQNPQDEEEIFNDCSCSTCTQYSLHYLHSIKGTTNFCMLLTAHNLHYMSMLGKRMRDALANESFPGFVAEYMSKRFGKVPGWIEEAMGWVNIDLVC